MMHCVITVAVRVNEQSVREAEVVAAPAEARRRHAGMIRNLAPELHHRKNAVECHEPVKHQPIQLICNVKQYRYGAPEYGRRQSVLWNLAPGSDPVTKPHNGVIAEQRPNEDDPDCVAWKFTDAMPGKEDLCGI